MKRKVTSFLALVFILSCFVTLTASAVDNTYNYTATLPGVGDLSLADGYKGNNNYYAIHNILTLGDYHMNNWIDYDGLNGWERCTDYHNLGVGGWRYNYVYMKPSINTSCRLRVGGDIWHIGVSATGNVNF